ncbi:hypothetical protein ACWDR1_29455 [Streptosporangium sandarakinum]
MKRQASTGIYAEAQAHGYFGHKVDPTPNEHYTVAGVVEGKPTPETDVELSRQIRAELDERANRF